jgi:hypothetical protein
VHVPFQNADLVLLSSSWIGPDRAGLIGLVRSDLNIFNLRSGLTSSQTGPIGPMGLMKLIGKIFKNTKVTWVTLECFSNEKLNLDRGFRLFNLDPVA